MGRIADIAQDIAVVVGFAGIGYGLWTLEPWVSYTVCGGMLLWFGLSHQRGGGQ